MGKLVALKFARLKMNISAYTKIRQWEYFLY